VSPVKYELGSYIPVDDILHSHRRENLKSYRYESCSLKNLQLYKTDFAIRDYS
jgi:hypothetical protein